MPQLTKPTANLRVITGNEFMQRGLGISAFHKASEGAKFDVNQFDEALKEFQRAEITKATKQQVPKGAEETFKVDPVKVNRGVVKLRQQQNKYAAKLNQLMKPPRPKEDKNDKAELNDISQSGMDVSKSRAQQGKETSGFWAKQWSFLKKQQRDAISANSSRHQESFKNMRPLSHFLGQRSVNEAQRFLSKEIYEFQDAKEVIHAVSLPPLPTEKIRKVMTKNGQNSGILKVLNFNLKIFDIKDKMNRLRTTENDQSNLDGSIGGVKSDKESSYINSELNRKINVIKKKSGVKVFQVKRYEGEPTMNPRNNPREIEEPPIEPPPKPIYPLFSVKNPEHRPETEVPDRGDQESYHLTTQDEDEIKKMQEEINRLDEQRVEQQLASSQHSESHLLSSPPKSPPPNQTKGLSPTIPKSPQSSLPKAASSPLKSISTSKPTLPGFKESPVIAQSSVQDTVDKSDPLPQFDPSPSRQIEVKENQVSEKRLSQKGEQSVAQTSGGDYTLDADFAEFLKQKYPDDSQALWKIRAKVMRKYRDKQLQQSMQSVKEMSSEEIGVMKPFVPKIKDQIIQINKQPLRPYAKVTVHVDDKANKQRVEPLIPPFVPEAKPEEKPQIMIETAHTDQEPDEQPKTPKLPYLEAVVDEQQLSLAGTFGKKKKKKKKKKLDASISPSQKSDQKRVSFRASDDQEAENPMSLRKTQTEESPVKKKSALKKVMSFGPSAINSPEKLNDDSKQTFGDSKRFNIKPPLKQKSSQEYFSSLTNSEAQPQQLLNPKSSTKQLMSGRASVQMMGDNSARVPMISAGQLSIPLNSSRAPSSRRTSEPDLFQEMINESIASNKKRGREGEAWKVIKEGDPNAIANLDPAAAALSSSEQPEDNKLRLKMSNRSISVDPEQYLSGGNLSSNENSQHQRGSGIMKNKLPPKVSEANLQKMKSRRQLRPTFPDEIQL